MLETPGELYIDYSGPEFKMFDTVHMKVMNYNKSEIVMPLLEIRDSFSFLFQIELVYFTQLNSLVNRTVKKKLYKTQLLIRMDHYLWPKFAKLDLTQ